MLQTIKIILELLPLIIRTVKDLEALFPESGYGSFKFSLIINTLEQVQSISDDVMPFIESTINTVVKVFNSFGIFDKIADDAKKAGSPIPPL